MHLNIHLIYDEIQDSVMSSVMKDDIIFDLSGIRCYSDQIDKFHESVLYILTQEQYCSTLSDKIKHVILIGEFEIVPENRFLSCLSMPDDIDQLELLRTVQDVFDRYHAWAERLNEMIFDQEPLQDVFDLACRFLRNPTALFDSSNTLLMVAGKVPNKKTGSIWDAVLAKGYSPKEKEEAYLNKMLSSDTPFYFRSSDMYAKHERLIARISYHGTMIGMLGMTDIEAPITKAEYAKLVLVQSFMQRAFFVSDENKSYLSETPWYLSQLLKRKLIDHSLIEYYLSTHRKKTTDPYRLWMFSPMEQKDDLSDLIPALKRVMPDAIIFRYEGRVLCCNYDSLRENEDITIQKIEGFSVNFALRVSRSMVFENFYDLRLAYEQCRIAQEVSSEEDMRLSLFSSIMPMYLIRCLEQQTELEAVIDPRLRNVFHKDEQYARELLHFLMAYIRHGGNLSATASDLFIHRHTAIYRIESIQDITGINLKDTDEDEIFHLYLSCMLLLHIR